MNWPFGEAKVPDTLRTIKTGSLLKVPNAAEILALTDYTYSIEYDDDPILKQALADVVDSKLSNKKFDDLCSNTIRRAIEVRIMFCIILKSIWINKAKIAVQAKDEVTMGLLAMDYAEVQSQVVVVLNFMEQVPNSFIHDEAFKDNLTQLRIVERCHLEFYYKNGMIVRNSDGYDTDKTKDDDSDDETYSND